jgi:hypothetical protein
MSTVGTWLVVGAALAAIPLSLLGMSVLGRVCYSHVWSVLYDGGLLEAALADNVEVTLPQLLRVTVNDSWSRHYHGWPVPAEAVGAGLRIHWLKWHYYACARALRLTPWPPVLSLLAVTGCLLLLGGMGLFMLLMPISGKQPYELSMHGWLLFLDTHPLVAYVTAAILAILTGAGVTAGMVRQYWTRYAVMDAATALIESAEEPIPVEVNDPYRTDTGWS